MRINKTQEIALKHKKKLFCDEDGQALELLPREAVKAPSLEISKPDWMQP